MVNYNMGQYYAWSNLNKLIRNKLKGLRGGPLYQFKYIPPQSMRSNIVPFEQWKGRTSFLSLRSLTRGIFILPNPPLCSIFMFCPYEVRISGFIR